MPEIRNFEVTQVRSVRVQANNLADAVRIASAAFENGKAPDGVWGNTTGRIRDKEIYVSEKKLGE